MVHVAKLNFKGDPNVGLYCVASDKVCLVGKSVPAKQVAKLKEVFKVPVIQANVYGTSLIGIFASAAKDVLLLPDVIFERELTEIKAASTKLGIKVKTFKTDKTALANNILCNDKVGIVSTEFSKEEVAEIEKLLGIKTIQLDIAEMDTPGSAGVLTSRGAMFGPNLSDEEIAKVEKLLGFEVGLGSINMGSPVIHSGVVANSHGFIVGGLSSGYEIGRVEESLGFLE